MSAPVLSRAPITRALTFLGIAYRLRRCRRLLRARRLAEVDRVSAAVGRDLAWLLPRVRT